MIWVHGGAWRMGDKRGVNHKPIAFNAHGFLFVSINYRLTPEITIPEQAADVAQAVAWVRHHAVEYGGSPDAIFLMGHSAGAHLVALTAINPSYLQKEGMNPSYLKGVILLDGAAYDVPHQIASARLPRLKQMYLTAFSNDEEKQRLASPIFHVSPNNSIPPFLILHVADRLDGKLQSNALGEKLRAAGVQAEVIPAEGKSHLTINRELGISDDKPTEEVFRFLESRLQKLEKKPE